MLKSILIIILSFSTLFLVYECYKSKPKVVKEPKKELTEKEVNMEWKKFKKEVDLEVKKYIMELLR